MRIINWNVKWANPDSIRGTIISQEILKRKPEIVCVTEGHQHLLLQDGFTIYSSADYGYNSSTYKRKVSLWSKNPWTNIDYLGDESLPAGRFVSGKTMTSIGEIDCIGVCIPWRDAHVITGLKDKKRWEDHGAYLKGLKKILSEKSESPLILLGDFNQRIPRPRKYGQPIWVYEQILDSIPNRLNLATIGDLPGFDMQLIDHVAHTTDIFAHRVLCIDKYNEDFSDDKEISDHFGVVVDFNVLK